MLNWIDWVILGVVAIYVLKGWEEGLIKLSTGLISFLGALWLSIRYHQAASGFLVDKFGIPTLWGGVLGYAIVWLVSEAAIEQLVFLGVSRLPQKISTSRINRYLGATLSALKAAIFTAFIFLLLLALPLRGSVKSDIESSKIGSWLVKLAEKYGGQVKSELDQVVKQTARFMTIKPASNESVDLAPVIEKNPKLSISESGEKQMLELVNAERAKMGVAALTIDNRLTTVARAHSRDMFERKYFSHYSPEGFDVGDRLDKAQIDYQVAGENLAYAPSVQIAHDGLMNSEGHRKNILNPEFKKIGIGVIDADSSGLMFTQVFTN